MIRYTRAMERIIIRNAEDWKALALDRRKRSKTLVEIRKKKQGPPK